MTYKIIYADGKCCNCANGMEDLLEWVKLLKDETITDIRKVYKSGAEDSVIDRAYIREAIKTVRGGERR